ncbi:pectinesterase family protein [uncultured Fibrobacter sp.]|uniref:pectinesterase family protein n=1 Tax=uncultured Fibrobacter sp. TaxID=261512 RepID=UPI0025D26B41|nr:pectinesterase family protein [uncultured Fibrobacter sp.]
MLNGVTSKICLLATLGLAISASAVEKKKIDFVLGVDGDFKAAIAAANASGASANNRFVLFVPDGEYDITKLTGDEHGKTTFSASNVSIVGQSVDKTIIWNTTDTEGISTTATLYFPKNNNMYMQDITLQNKGSYNSGNAARQVALQQNEGDKFIYKNVLLLSGQDTYYTKKGRTYWEGGEIDGTVDFICGGGDVFFEGTKLVMTRNGGYITASQNPGDWGYVFNNATITVSNSSYNGTFYLGRSWGHAKTVFLNTKMIAQPKAEGWGPDMNSAPQVFGEYNSKDGDGNSVNTSMRKTYFNGGKDASTATTLKTVWNASDAAKYTLSNVLKGSDNWDPTKLTAQVKAPKIEQQGAEIVWADDDNARAWVVFVNGRYKANVVAPSFALDGIAVGSKITVRAANSMGGLGAYSNEVATVDANATYYKVTLGDAIGGKVTTNLSSDKVLEGKTAIFTAEPNEGWTFAGWSGKSAADIDASKATAEIVAACDIELIPSFTAKGTTVFQVEDGIITNAAAESNNAGFNGTAFVNFAAGDLSTILVPVYAEVAGEYQVEIRYANGSGKARSLAAAAPGECAAGIDGCKSAETLSFAATTNWTTWDTLSIAARLPAGASYFTFATIGGNDGPNLDQVELKLLKADVTTAIRGLATPGQQLVPTTRVRLFTLTGQLIRESVGLSVSTENLAPGVYLLQRGNGSLLRQQIIRVK